MFKLPRLPSDSQYLLGSKFLAFPSSFLGESTFKKVLVVMVIKCTLFLRHLLVSLPPLFMAMKSGSNVGAFEY